MRRELKPSLRQDTITNAKIVTPPETEEEVEIVLLADQSTTLHYDGSPLMSNQIVSDPNGVLIQPGTDSNYKDESWIAIGLATDNVRNANNNIATNEFGQDIGPLDGSGGDFQPPNGSAASGAVYSAIGPSRGALFFDLGEIPSDAQILEATLELFPYNDADTIGDPYGEQTTEFVWPAEGVTCEILNLPRDATSSATWNTKTGSLKTFSNADGTVNFVAPLPEDRWWREEDGVLPPNPIGLQQNTRRSDIGEPIDLFVSQAIDTDLNLNIDGPEGDTIAEEYYGHIGYGIFGGGFAVNIPDPANPGSGHPRFHISFNKWSEHIDFMDQAPFEVDVSSLVEYGMVNGRRCNLLLRASNWGDNTAAQNPDEQLTFEDIPDIQPLEFTFAHLSDIEGGSEINEISNDGTLHVVTDIVNADSVSYEWLIEVPVSPFDSLDFLVSGEFVEGSTVRADNVTYNGGDPNTDVIEYQWIVDGNDIDAPNALNQQFSIPNGEGGFGGRDLRVRVTVSNPTEGLTPISKTSDPVTVSFDGIGFFILSKSTPDGDTVTENTGASVVISAVAGVANPTFDYKWYKSQFSDGSNNIGDISETLNTSSLSNTVTAPEGDYSGGIPNFLVCEVTLYEGTSSIQTQSVSWILADAAPPQTPAQKNGVYKVDNVAVFTNCSSNPDQLLAYEYSVLEGCSYQILEEPSQAVACDENTGQYGTPFGYYVSSRQLVPVQPGNLDDYYFFASTPPSTGLIGFASKGDGNAAGSRIHQSSQIPLNSCTTINPIQMITVNGYNGTVESGSGKKPGSVAVWIPDFSETNGWIVMDAKDKPVSRLNGTPGIPGFSTGGLINAASTSDPGHDSGYGSFVRTECLFGQSNNYIAWNVRTGTNAPTNADNAVTFLRNLQPVPSVDATASSNPSSITTNKLNDVYLVFFDKELTDTEAEGWVSEPITNIDPSYGGSPAAGGVIESLGIPSDSIVHPDNTGNVYSSVLWQLTNFDGTYSGWDGVSGTTSVMLTPQNFDIYDCTSHNEICVPTSKDPDLPVNMLERGEVGDTEVGGSGQAFFDPALNDGSESFPATQLGWYTRNDTTNWNFNAAVQYFAVSVYLNSIYNPATQRLMMEVIRDGALVGRTWMRSSGELPVAGGVSMLFSADGSGNYANFNSFYPPTKWQIGDVITISVVDRSTDNIFIDVPR